MAYNEKLADRAREILTSATKHKIEEKQMFGGLCFMVNNKMCVGVESKRMMVRFDPVLTEELMAKDGCRPMEFTGKAMKGYAFVDLEVLKTKKALEHWIQLALDFNDKAKSSKKKKL